MADSHVSLTAGSGINMDSSTVTTADGTNQRQRISIGSATANNNMVVDANGSAKTALYDSAGNALVTYPADSVTAGLLGVAPMLYNGFSWDRQRSVDFATAALNVSGATTTQTSATYQNYNWRGLSLNILNAIGTSISLQLVLISNGLVANIWKAAANVTGGPANYLIYPHAVAPTHTDFTEIVQLPLPGGPFQIQMIHNNSNAATYQVTFFPLI